jgi:hypothetical protein
VFLGFEVLAGAFLGSLDADLDGVFAMIKGLDEIIRRKLHVSVALGKELGDKIYATE